MANDEHIALLKKGVEAWNAWRQENPDIYPDLSEANFSGANFSEANFSEANFSEANFRHPRNGRERRNVGACPLLVGGDNVTGGAPLARKTLPVGRGALPTETRVVGAGPLAAST